MLNPQFPHTFSVTRDVNSGTTYNPTITTTAIASGVCRFYQDNGGSKFGGVRIADYQVSLPATTADIKIGDKISCINGLIAVDGIVKLAHTSNFGTNIWFTIVAN